MLFGSFTDSINECQVLLLILESINDASIAAVCSGTELIKQRQTMEREIRGRLDLPQTPHKFQFGTAKHIYYINTALRLPIITNRHYPSLIVYSYLEWVLATTAETGNAKMMKFDPYLYVLGAGSVSLKTKQKLSPSWTLF